MIVRDRVPPNIFQQSNVRQIITYSSAHCWMQVIARNERRSFSNFKLSQFAVVEMEVD